MSEGKVIAVVPAYCEERWIADVVRKAQPHVAEVLVVDDGSPDATSKHAAAAGATVCQLPHNQGKGQAIKTGLEEALKRGAQYIVLLDGDNQHNPDEISQLCDAARNEDAALVVGARNFDFKQMPLVRSLTNRFMSWWISAACGQRVLDTQCGFRVLRADAAQLVLERCHAARYEYETEMLLELSHAALKIASAPVSTIYGDTASKIKVVRDTLRFLKLMIRYQVLGRLKSAR